MPCVITRHPIVLQNEWVPISRDTAISTCLIVPTREESPSINPHQNNTTPKELLATNGSMFRFRNYLTNPELCRDSPLPTLHWADSQEVWQLMLKKDKMYVRNAQLLARHPGLQTRMRSILLDWLIEVSAFYIEGKKIIKIICSHNFG